MAKIKLNPIVEQVSGGFGNIVFRRSGEGVIIARKAGERGAASEAQAAHRERFRLAVLYAQGVLANPIMRAVYEAAAARKDKPAFALGVADYLNEPHIDAVDLSAYSGQPGDLLTVRAHDDFGVTAVLVSIRDESDAHIESGPALETPIGSGEWAYAAANTVAAGSLVRVSVTVSDRAGGTDEQTLEKTL
jgi:hypothetical protein